MWRLGQWVNRPHHCGVVLLLIISVHYKEVTSFRCEVGRELDSHGHWKWVFPYRDLCKCTSIVMGGLNTWSPERTYSPVYIVDDIKEIQQHYYFICMGNHPDTDVSDHDVMTSSAASSLTHNSMEDITTPSASSPTTTATTTSSSTTTAPEEVNAFTDAKVDINSLSTQPSYMSESNGTTPESLQQTTRQDGTFTTSASGEAGASWQYTNNWDECSVTCGPGKQSRTQVCLSAEGTPANTLCTGDPVMEEKICTLQACPIWQYMDDWSGCSATCGGGTQHRTQKCMDTAGQSAGGLCNGDPATQSRSCEEEKCGGCFASDSSVYVKMNSVNGTFIQRKRLDQLKVGDYVESFDPETNSITFSQVYFITHDEENTYSFTLLKLVIGYEDQREISLRLHPKHLVYACQHSTYSKQHVTCSRPSLTPIRAESVQPGDTLWLRNSTNTLSPTPVLYIEKIKSGIRHPMTLNHYIVVDNILASVHMYDEGLYRYATAPLRFVYGINPIVTDTWLVKELVQMWDVVETNIL